MLLYVDSFLSGVSLPKVEDEFERRQIVKSEEGEMMVYTAMSAMFTTGFTHDKFDKGNDSVSVTHSDDSNAFAGISMQFVYNLESTCIKSIDISGEQSYSTAQRSRRLKSQSLETSSQQTWRLIVTCDQQERALSSWLIYLLCIITWNRMSRCQYCRVGIGLFRRSPPSTQQQTTTI